MSPEVQEFVYDYGEVSCDDPPPLVRSDDEAVYVVPEAAARYGVDPDNLQCCTRALWLAQANFSLPELEAGDNSRLANFTLPPGGSAKFGDIVECVPPLLLSTQLFEEELLDQNLYTHYMNAPHRRN